MKLKKIDEVWKTVRIHFLSERWEASALTTESLLLPLSLLTTLPLLLFSSSSFTSISLLL